jgi:hypothetical protein
MLFLNFCPAKYNLDSLFKADKESTDWMPRRREKVYFVCGFSAIWYRNP